MFSDLACDCDVYLVTGYTDMRKGIDGLATIVQGMQEESSMKPYLQMKKLKKHPGRMKVLKESTNCLLSKGNMPKYVRKNDIHNGRNTQKRFLTAFTHGLKR